MVNIFNRSHEIITNHGNVIKEYREGVTNKISDLFCDKLSRYHEGVKSYFRSRQNGAFNGVIQGLKKGIYKGLIKLPMGTGKTVIFCNIAKSINAPTIILVPKVGLVKDVYEELVGNHKKSGVGYGDNEVCKITSLEVGTASEKLQNYLDDNSGIFHGVLVTTYSSLNSIRKNNEGLIKTLLESVKLYVSDEAHRSLGEQTQTTSDYLMDNDVNEIQNLLENNENEKIHIMTTATPKLINKDVRDGVYVYYDATMQEVSDDGDLIIPKLKSIGTAYLNIDNYDGNNNTIRQCDLGSPLEKYIADDGQYVYAKIAEMYLFEKAINCNYLPSVGFCTTVEQADFITNYLNSIGIRAIRCTSNKGGLNSENCSDEQAKKLIENNGVDVVVTCSKVGEGWDVPNLRCAMWFTPTSSPARNLQGNGRLTRVISDELEHYYKNKIGNIYQNKTQANTIIIEPDQRQVKNKSFKTKDTCKDKLKNNNGIKNKYGDSDFVGETHIGTINGSHAMMYELGEINWDGLDDLGVDTSILDKKLTYEEFLEKHRLELNNNNIYNNIDLYLFGAKAYESLFGVSSINLILTPKKRVTNKRLLEMGEKLGLMGMLESHKNALIDHNINNMHDLLNLGVSGYRKIFNDSIFNFILGNEHTFNFKGLEQLGLAIGFIKTEHINTMDDNRLIIKHINDLNSLIISSHEELIDLGPHKYEKIFKVKTIGKILGKTIKKVTFIHLKELAILLDWKEKSNAALLGEHLLDLKKNCIINMEGLIGMGPIKYKKLFKEDLTVNLILKKIFSITFRDFKESHLEEISLALGFTPKTKLEYIEQHKTELLELGIKNIKELILYGPVLYNKNFGIKYMRSFFGKEGKNNKEYIQLLGEQLWGDTLSECHKKELINNRCLDLVDFTKIGPEEYQKTYGVIIGGLLLGKKFKNFKVSDIKELGNIIFQQ